MCAGPAADCALPPTGGALRLEHARTSLGLALCVERRGAAALLARPGAPYARLVHGRAQSASGAVKFAADVAAGVSLWSLARACEGTGGGGCDGEEDEARRGGGEGAAAAPVRACVELRPANAPAHALAFDSSTGALRLVRAGSPEAVWYRDDDDGDGTGGGADSLAGTPASEHARAEAQAKAQTRAGGLDRADAVALAAAYERDGYVVVPGACPEGKVSAALRVLNHFLGSANIVEDVEEGAIGSEFAEEGAAPLVKLGSGHRCTCSLAQQAALRDLVRGPVQALSEAALGGRRMCTKPWGAQVALRYPLYPSADACGGGDALPPLLRRMDWHTDAEKYNSKKRLDFVVGVFLSPVRSERDGCLWVRPGSHRPEHRADAGACERAGMGGARPPEPPEAVPILAPVPGTLIVFHPWLQHAGGPNLGDSVRYAIYSRLRLEPEQDA